MRWLAVVSLLCSQLAVAADAEAADSASPATERESWLGNLTAGSPSFFFNSSGGVATGEVGLSAGCTLFFQRLIDDPSHPLALLEFFQHPDTLTVTPRFAESWFSASHSYDATVSADGAWFFLPRTALIAAFSGTASWQAPSGGAAANMHTIGSIGVQRYLATWLRVEGSVSVSASPAATTGGAGVRVTAVLANDRVLLDAVASMDTKRMAYASLSASYFLGRRVSAGLAISGTYDAQRPFPTNALIAQIQPRVSVKIYLTHATALIAGYGFNIDRSLQAATFVTQVSSSASVVVSWRF
jgi:hypothetical protein